MKFFGSHVLFLFITGISFSQAMTEEDHQGILSRVGDIDGNTYAVRIFNNKAWMAQNLRVTRDTTENTLTYYYPGGDPLNLEEYGLLYDFETALKVCPAAWHLPSDEEWEALFSEMDQDDLLMVKDPGYWKEEERTLAGESAFAARPAGYGNSGEFDNFFGTHAVFWSSSVANATEGLAYSYILISGKESYHRAPQHMSYAFSVRCVRDASAGAYGSDTLKQKDRECEQQAIGDLFRKKNKAPKPPKKMSALVLPNISSNPTNGFMLGIGGALGWYMGPQENTKVSSANFTAAVTSRDQLLTFIKPNIYTRNNDFFLQGDWRFYIYSQPTYGLGTNAPDTLNVPEDISWMGQNAGADSALFPMKFNYFKFHQVVNRRLYEELYAGLGYQMDYYYSIVDEKYRPATETTDELLTPHHAYSETYGFPGDDYMVSGFSLNALYDTRDNQISPYRGIYANVNYRINPQFLGSDENSSSLWLEFRTYLSLSEKTERHVLGFWMFGNFQLTGAMPYLTLPALGEDQRARSGRGYTNGRFRGDKMVYGEVEWRFPISPCTKILGGVIFANAVTTSNPIPGREVKLFQYIRPAVGFGIRVMVNKHFRTNINLDFAIGKDAKGFYFSGQETF